ncbi:MarR family winged helix-turn-helix transcriptional regulator [Lacticaseibacillus absianus]|uniref:MarR family winged helix-turn-helix transcriptional regulator n=1 Tax=Lacticaseibacillus absianus TaxID=2729623 RepID=UPI0015CDA781|nr:MarR family winged helix-turn-helix transcriptional regulator [Lacticaseibacillus absianus]
MGDPQLLQDYLRMYWQTFKKLDELIAEPMKADGLSFEQFLIMRDLAAGHELAVSEIAQRRGVTRAAISRQIKVLITRGMVVQERQMGDRRRLPLALTPAGAAVTARLNQQIEARFAYWVELLGEADARELLRLMERVGERIIQR